MGNAGLITNPALPIIRSIYHSSHSLGSLYGNAGGFISSTVTPCFKGPYSWDPRPHNEVPGSTRQGCKPTKKKRCCVGFRVRV